MSLKGEFEGTVAEMAKKGGDLALKAGLSPGPIPYLWADDIANQLYADYH